MKIATVDMPISRSTISHDHAEVPTQPKLTFIQKKLAIRVGGMSMRETRVNTFMILF